MLVADRHTGVVSHTDPMPPINQNHVPHLREVEKALQALRALHGTGSKPYLDTIARFLNLKE